MWHNPAPAWPFQDENKRPLPREKALANRKVHIDAVAGHFRGKVIGWDVVNEAISDAPGEYLRDTPARRAIGDDYVVKAFEIAEAADPGAELYDNDYSNENPEKRGKTIRAKFYREVFEALGKHRDVVTRVTFWGTHDGTSWLNSWPTRWRTNHELWLDRELRPKAAHVAVVEALGK